MRITGTNAFEILTNWSSTIWATKHLTTESRFHAFGSREDQRFLHITFTLRAKATLLRVMSARNMSRNERKIYESKT